jgi:hypothetical protein
MPGEVIPFGKYKGQPVEVLASDRDYCNWLMAQTWFGERYPQVHTLVINNFGEPTETPEHNALQIRLLDDGFRAKCTEAALRFFDADRQWTHRVDRGDGHTEMSLVTPYFTTPRAPQFEVGGMDVLWEVDLWQICHTCGPTHPTTLPDRHQSLWEKRSYRRGHGDDPQRIAVECKPLIGDDYPAILRFLTHIRHPEIGIAHRMVLAGDVRSQTVSLQAIKQFFALSHILLVLVDEVEATAVPHMVQTTPDLEAHAVYLAGTGERCRACLGVEGRQRPYEIPITPGRLWEVLSERCWSMGKGRDSSIRAFLREGRILTCEADRVQIAVGHTPWGGEALSPEQVAQIQEMLHAILGRDMTVALIPREKEEAL